MTMMAGETLVEPPDTIQATQASGLPVVIPEPRPPPRRARWRRLALAAVVVAAGAGGAAWWFTHGGAGSTARDRVVQRPARG